MNVANTRQAQIAVFPQLKNFKVQSGNLVVPLLNAKDV